MLITDMIATMVFIGMVTRTYHSFRWNFVIWSIFKFSLYL